MTLSKVSQSWLNRAVKELRQQVDFDCRSNLTIIFGPLELSTEPALWTTLLRLQSELLWLKSELLQLKSDFGCHRNHLTIKTTHRVWASRIHYRICVVKSELLRLKNELLRLQSDLLRVSPISFDYKDNASIMFGPLELKKRRGVA